MSSQITMEILDFLSTGMLNMSWLGVFLFTLAVTHITIAAVTIYLHRCQAHRALDLHPVVSHFFRFWLWLTTGQVTREWAAIHRKHHAKCETDEDPHSPVAKGIKKVFFQGAELYRAEAKNKETIQKYGHGTPDDWIERNVYSRHQILGVASMLILDVLLFGVIGVTVWAVQMLWIPITAAGIINGIGHYWGYRNYDCQDASTNIVPFGILIGGEELHNNHHTFASSAKLSNKWYEFDIGWMYIRILSALGLATVKKVAPKPKFNTSKQVADLDTLQAVIANRYEIMARYAQSMRMVCRDELALLREKTKLEPVFLKRTTRLLEAEPSRLKQTQKQQIGPLLPHSASLQVMHDMRVELAAIWEKSTATRDQLLAKLQAWCTRAEQSGVMPLREFALSLRTYC